MGKSTEYFKTSNPLNAAMNVFSGNVLPLSEGKESLDWASRIWVAFIWLLRMMYFWTAVIGSTYLVEVTMSDIFQRGGAIGVLSLEAFLPPAYFFSRQKYIRKLIKKYNLVLVDEDCLRKCVNETLKPYVTGLKIFIAASIASSAVWGVAPFFEISGEEHFSYIDFNVPTYFPGEPFGPGVFIAGVIFQMIGCCSMDCGKISVDFYVIHFIAMLTAQYKYVGEQISLALHEKNEDEAAVINDLRRCIRHQTAVIDVAQSLTKLLALHVGATYLICIFKFCFLVFGFVKFEGAYIEKCSYLLCIVGCVLQVFLLCSCIQQVQEHSTSVTDGAFHENWHARSNLVKKIFCMIGLTNQMECRLSAWRIIDLVVPTLAAILSKSYSVCLLLLEVD